MSRNDILRMTLQAAEQARYFRIKDWYRTNIDRDVSAEAETYILERVLSGRPCKGGELMRIGRKVVVPDLADQVTLFPVEDM